LSIFLIGLENILSSGNLKCFIFSYIALLIALFFAFFDSKIVCGLFVGLSVLLRSMAASSSGSAMGLIQGNTKWKWFSIFYFLMLFAWVLINNDHSYQLNPLLGVFVLMFPFIIPYALSEYRIYQSLVKAN